MREHEKGKRFGRRSISNVAAISFITIAFIVGGGAVGLVVNLQNAQSQQTSSLSTTTPATTATTTVTQQSGVSQLGYATPVCVSNTGNAKIT
ncbi:MAG TPA: hypothetical protein VED17_00240, partial [Nitrososphaerales archaeon]|nr:hypothetical protein [Nitrososphaerales archaeon]